MAVATIETPTVETVEVVEPVITMEFWVAQRALADKLTAIAPAVSKRSTLPILSNVKIKTSTLGVKLTATNLEIMIDARVPADETSVYSYGETTTNYKELVEIVRPLTGMMLHFACIDGILTLDADGLSIPLSTMSAEEYPAAATDQGDQSMGLPVETFRRLVQMSGFAADTSDARPVLNSILLNVEKDDYVTAVSADGFRLAVASECVPGIEAGHWSPILIPAYALLPVVKNSQFPKTGYLTISASSSQVKFEVGGLTIVSRLIDGTFPNYTVIMPKEENINVRADVNVADLVRFMKVAKVVARDASNITPLVVSRDGFLKIPVTRDGQKKPADISLRAQTHFDEGEEFTTMVNHLYLDEVITAAARTGSDMIHFGFQAAPKANKPLEITFAGLPGFTYILMPMHVNR